VAHGPSEDLAGAARIAECKQAPILDYAADPERSAVFRPIARFDQSSEVENGALFRFPRAMNRRS
jgi:hypothetical protein